MAGAQITEDDTMLINFKKLQPPRITASDVVFVMSLGWCAMLGVITSVLGVVHFRWPLLGTICTLVCTLGS